MSSKITRAETVELCAYVAAISIAGQGIPLLILRELRNGVLRGSDYKELAWAVRVCLPKQLEIVKQIQDLAGEERELSSDELITLCGFVDTIIDSLTVYLRSSGTNPEKVTSVSVTIVAELMAVIMGSIPLKLFYDTHSDFQKSCEEFTKVATDVQFLSVEFTNKRKKGLSSLLKWGRG